MEQFPETQKIEELLSGAKRVVIMQADNPDGDSLGSALALEQILHDLGKEPVLYCGVDIPTYLRYLPGWDRAVRDLPKDFDLSIIVDTSADSLFENLESDVNLAQLGKKPCVILDHHAVKNTIPFATIVCNHPAVATGEVIYELAKQLDWPLDLHAKNMIATAIMSDSLGLTTPATSGRSIHIIGELVDGGVSIPTLENERRKLMRKSPDLIKYKGELLQRIEYYANDQIATITIPWAEIEKYSPFYNPSMLVIDDMRMTVNTHVAIAFKLYKDGKVTAKIRGNFEAPIAAKLAEHFGGGGHKFASGFKVRDGRAFKDIKSECIELATKLIAELPKEQHETL